jgi:hypothetical protein
MNWEKKKKIVWGCFTVASLTALVGAVVHPIMFVIGMAGLVCVMGFCMVDK